jgi:hypothetical protein
MANTDKEKNQGGAPEGADKTPTPTPEPTGNDGANQDPPAAPAPAAPATFTQEQVNVMLATAKRDADKAAKAAEEKAKLSEDERLRADLESLRRENQLIKAEGEITKLLQAAGAKSPGLLFAVSKEKLDFAADGKLSNSKELVAELQLAYPDQFGAEKPKDTIDGGKGDQAKPAKAETLSQALSNHYKKKQ